MCVHTVFFISILQNILFCVPQKKESHTGMEQLEGEYMTAFSFLVNYPFEPYI